MNKQQIQKTEAHITTLPREIDQSLAVALGEMVVAFGRLEDMFKVAIKRLENKRTLDQIIVDFSGMRGTLGALTSHCRSNFPMLSENCDEAEKLNTHRQDFIHATFAATEKGRYVRFRKLMGYADINTDVEQIRGITENANSLIEELDRKTGALLNDLEKSNKFIATVSVASSFRS